jgi:adenylate cyclase, class 2
MNDQELEIKFYLLHPDKFSRRMRELQAEHVSRRTNEWNLRFDNSTGGLSKSGQALRLRKDNRVRLTFKGSSQARTDITARQELEVTVSDFQTTRLILEALGFQVAVIYEKYRTTWHLDGTEVVLDELPIGTFCEIEGENAEQIQAVAEKLNLDWEKRIGTSYLGIFAQLKETLAWPSINLTYKDMTGIPVNEHDLAWINIHPGDEETNT